MFCPVHLQFKMFQPFVVVQELSNTSFDVIAIEIPVAQFLWYEIFDYQ